MRQTLKIPNQLGNFTLAFPSRNESYRLVSLHALFTNLGLVNAKSLVLVIIDGDGNSIYEFQTILVSPAFTGSFTWCAAAVDVAISGNFVSGQFVTVPIPNDVWIQPNWRVVLLPLPAAEATDQTNGILLQTESYERPKKTVAPRDIEAQDSPP